MFYATEVLGQCGQMDTGHRKQPELRTRVQLFFGAEDEAVFSGLHFSYSTI